LSPDDLPGPDPQILAEQALLGALLLSPHRVPLVSWLRADHFLRMAHRELFRALLELAAAGHPGNKAGAASQDQLALVRDVLATASAQVPGLTPSYPHTLIARCPRPDHAHAYARMVLESAIHRSVTEHATRLVQLADQAQDVDLLLHHLDLLSEVLGEAERTWNPSLRPTKQVPAAGPAAAAGEPRAQHEQRLSDELMLLTLLLQAPSCVDDVASWLEPADFTSTGNAHLFGCLVAVQRRGDPVDVLTVLWEARRRGLLDTGALSTDGVLALDSDLAAGDPGYWGLEVLRAGLAKQAGAAAREVLRLAQQSCATERLVPAARAALAGVEGVRLRWHRATADAPTRARGPDPPPLVLHTTARPAHLAREHTADRSAAGPRRPRS
jgi:replicative DNA helicase